MSLGDALVLHPFMYINPPKYSGSPLIYFGIRSHKLFRTVAGALLRALACAVCVAGSTTVLQADETRPKNMAELLRLPTFENLPNKYQRTVEYYAQINPGNFRVDNGGGTDSRVEDNDASPSRIGFYVNWVYPDTGKLLFNFETGLGVRGSSDGRISGETSSVDIGREDIRHLEF